MTNRTTIVAGLVSFVLVPAAQAQAPQPTGGVVPPRAIIGIVHSNGLDPVGKPVREGPTYVVRAVNRRGLLMRVVVDARSGQIHAVNQIVPGPSSPGLPGSAGRLATSPLPPYGPPPEFDQAPTSSIPEDSAAMPPGLPMRPPVVRAPRVTASASPPLPRPRPTDAAVVMPPVEGKPAAAAAAPEPQPESGAKPLAPADAAPINE